MKIVIVSWILVFILVLIHFICSSDGENFARSGAAIVSLVLMSEVLIIRQIKQIKDQVEEKVSDEVGIANYQAERARRPQIKADPYIVSKNAIARIVYPKELIAQTNILLMAIIGTILWGYGDLLFEWVISLYVIT